ncbi:MAG TPA: tetratricopeptide repeat protein [Dehalococcoidia bacterium]|nr:tetratricopeptide repeat protein [Dehalococcoidia bacterium]
MIPEIDTKTALPPLRPGVIRRQRLLALLDAQIGRRASFVAAPSGYGKTTLLADWASTQESAVCWLSLDPWDAEAPVFFRAVRHAFGRAFPESPLGRGSVAERPLDEAASVIAEVARLPEYVILVLDDFHLVQETSEIAEYIGVLVGRAPSNLHVIIASRLRPNFPGSARLVAQGEALLLGPADLAFTADEARELFRARGHEIEEGELSDVLRQTEGWGAALALASSTWRKTGRTALSRDDLFEYLAAEALTGLDERDRAFLRESSVLPVLTPALCDALLGRDDAAATLARLEPRALFLARVTADPPTYRLHQLFRDYLVESLKTEDPARFEELATAAVRLLIDSGRLNEALELAWTVGPGHAASVLDSVAQRLLWRGDHRTVLEWLERLPEKAVASAPRLRIWNARALAAVHRADDALAEIAAALEALGPDAEPHLLAEAHLARAGALRFKGDLAGAMEACEAAVSLLRRSGRPNEALEAEAIESMAYLHGEAGEFKKALAGFQRALHLVERMGLAGRAAKLYDSVARCHAELGNLPQAIRALERARAEYERVGNLYDLAITLNNTGMLHYMAGQFEQSLTYYARAAETGARVGNRRAVAYQQAGAADTYLALGDAERAVAMYEEARESAQALGDGALVEHCRNQMTVALLWVGQVDRARLLFESGDDAPEGTSRHAVRQLIRGRFALRQGDTADARALFREAAEEFRQLGMAREEATAWFLLAAAAFADRRRGEARDALERVGALCQAIGFERFLLPEVRQQSSVASYAASQSLAGGLFRRLLDEPSTSVTVEAATGVAAPLHVVSLGRTCVRLGDREIADSEWRSEKAREMLFFLLVEAKPLPKGEIFVALWPELPESKCNSNFHSTLHRLRNALYPEIVQLDGSRYSVNPNATIEFDVWRFRDALREAARLRGQPEEREHLECAYAAYGGPFLEGTYAEWVDEVRDTLQRQFVAAAGRLGTLRAYAGDHRAAIEAFRRALALDPYDEVAAQGLMASLVALGDHAAAAQHYRSYERLLREDLGSAPPRDMTRLYAALTRA